MSLPLGIKATSYDKQNCTNNYKHIAYLCRFRKPTCYLQYYTK